MDGETTFETWQPPKNVMLFESISNCVSGLVIFHIGILIRVLLLLDFPSWLFLLELHLSCHAFSFSHRPSLQSIIADSTQLGNPQTETTRDQYFHTNQFPGEHGLLDKICIRCDLMLSFCFTEKLYLNDKSNSILADDTLALLKELNQGQRRAIKVSTLLRSFCWYLTSL